MKIFSISILLISGFIYYGCSASQQENNENQSKEEKYVFDDVDVDSSIALTSAEIPEKTENENYIVQAGAFLSKSRAENFKEKLKSEIHKEMVLVFDSVKNLHLVQFTPVSSRKEAEEIIKDLTEKKYNDAFIIRSLK